MAVLAPSRAAAKTKLKTGGRVGDFDFMFFAIVILLLAFGLVMVFSASTPSSLYNSNDKFLIIRKQLMWALLGFVVMIISSFYHYSNYKKLANPLFFATIVLLLLVPFIGVTINGAKRWLGIGGLTFQPSELAKITFIIFLAKRFGEQSRRKIESIRYGLVPTFIAVGIIAVALVLQSHLSAIVIIVATAVVMMIAAGMKWSHLVVMCLFGAAGIILLAIFEPYRLARIMALIDPFKYKQTIGWQPVQSLLAVGSGGIFGLGLGQSRQKFLYIPEPHNDYIFAILCEELGFVGATAVILMFVVFVWRGICIAIKAPDTFASLTAFGITALVGLQVLINIGVVTSILPPTGMQLPFFSAGGSSLTILMWGMGIMLNISRSCNLNKT